jgi:5-methylcytosine-specific restriction protein A
MKESEIHFIPRFPIGSVIDNKTLYQEFGCKNVGGMRRSHRTNSLVLISDHTKSFYCDDWKNGVFHYSGMGKHGDQSLFFDQNKTLFESPYNGVHIHFFEVFVPTQYFYEGEVSLIDNPTQEFHPDREGLIRKVWVFRLMLKSNTIEFPRGLIQSSSVLQKRFKVIEIPPIPKHEYAETVDDSPLIIHVKNSDYLEY